MTNCKKICRQGNLAVRTVIEGFSSLLSFCAKKSFLKSAWKGEIFKSYRWFLAYGCVGFFLTKTTSFSLHSALGSAIWYYIAGPDYLPFLFLTHLFPSNFLIEWGHQLFDFDLWYFRALSVPCSNFLFGPLKNKIRLPMAYSQSERPCFFR